jgi:DNA-binding NarL/FixJ family response regulator
MDKVSEKKEFSVVVVDDQSLFREGLTKLIHNWPRAGKISANLSGFHHTY